MNKNDTARLTKVLAQVDELLDAPSKENPTIMNIDVLEAFYGDVTHIRNGREPKELAALIARDNENE